jgi:hypothetical protein
MDGRKKEEIQGDCERERVTKHSKEWKDRQTSPCIQELASVPS